MSHTFYIQCERPPSLSDLFALLPVVPAVRDSADLNTPIEAGYQYLYVPGETVRSYELGLEAGCLSVRIMSCSSPDDYRRALELVKAIATFTGNPIRAEDSDETMSVQELEQRYGESWIEQHCRQVSGMLLASSKTSVVNIKGEREDLYRSLHFKTISDTFHIGPRIHALLKEAGDQWLEVLFEKIRQFNYFNQSVFKSNLFQMGVGDTRFFRFTAYGPGVNYRITDHSTLVQVHTDDERQIWASLDHLYKYVPGACWLDEKNLFVPAQSADVWESLVNRLSDIDPAFMHDFIFSKDTDPHAHLLKDEDDTADDESVRSELAKLPTIIFFLVSMADGGVDAKEIKAFRKAMVEGSFSSALSGSDVAREIFHNALLCMADTLNALLDKQLDPLSALVKTPILMRRIDDNDAQVLKTALMDLGKSIASASGGFLGIFGSKISKEEQKALDLIETALFS